MCAVLVVLLLVLVCLHLHPVAAPHLLLWQIQVQFIVFCVCFNALLSSFKLYIGFA